MTLVHLIAGALARSYYLTKFARLVVRVYDNDGNADMYKNGEATIIKMVASITNGDSTVVDVGANVGDWSAALIDAGYEGHLVAIDPLRRNLAKVRERLGTLDCKRLELCEYALADQTGTAEFYTNRDPTLSGHDSLYDMRVIGYDERLERVNVQCITLDELANNLMLSRIHFLKIDIEGNELCALRGAKSLLHSGSIDFIQIEFGHAARAARIYLHDIVNFVREYSYKIYVIKPQGILPVEFTPFTENRYSYINFLLVRNELVSGLKAHVLRR